MKRKTSTSFYAGITFLIVVCSFAYSWKMLLPKYVSQKTELKSVETELKAATNKLESIKTTKKTLESIKPIKDQLFIAVPGDKDSPNLITELEAMAAKHKITIPSIQISDSSSASAAASATPAATPTAGNAVSIGIAVSGTFDTLSAFITSIEKDIRFMNIKSLSLGVDSQDANKMSLTLQIEAYKRSASASATPTATSATATPATTSAPSTGTATNATGGN